MFLPVLQLKNVFFGLKNRYPSILAELFRKRNNVLFSGCFLSRFSHIPTIILLDRNVRVNKSIRTLTLLVAILVKLVQT